MTDCDYCGESFGDEDAYLEHLRAEHYDELGGIDKRRVDAATGGDDGGIPVGPLAVGGVVVAAAAIVGYVVFIAGGSGGGDGATVNGIEVEQTPGQVSEEHHFHGTMNVTIAGERVDFSQQQYQLQDRAFHFESGDGERWHGHAPGITLEYAMATLGFDVSADSVGVDGETYSDDDAGTDVVVEVNGNSVTPSDYVLQEGDRVRIVVRTA